MLARSIGFIPPTFIDQGDDAVGEAVELGLCKVVPDDDILLPRFSPGSLTVDEGGYGSYDVTLNLQPLGNVTVLLSVSDPGAVEIEPTRLTFTRSDWNTPQSVTVRGRNDEIENAGSTRVATINHDITGKEYRTSPGEKVEVKVRRKERSTGEGNMSLGHGDARQSADIAMQLMAAGGRADLLRPESDGLALALKTDAFFVRTESANLSKPGAGNVAGATGNANRVRAALEGSHSFTLSGDREAHPGLPQPRLFGRTARWRKGYVTIATTVATRPNPAVSCLPGVLPSAFAVAGWHCQSIPLRQWRERLWQASLWLVAARALR